MSVNYGLDRVRFPTAVPVGGRVRARSAILEVRGQDDGSVQVTSRTTIEVDGVDKPACVAHTISRYRFKDVAAAPG